MIHATARTYARAWWMTVLIAIGIAAGAYFGWPQLAVYMGKTTMAGVMKKNARDCGQNRKDMCIKNIIAQAKAEADVQLQPADVRLLVATRKKVVMEIRYRTKLKYPFTGTMFGNGKWTYKRARIKQEIQLTGY